MDNQTYVQREIDARARLEMEARGLLDRAADESRDLSPEEEEQFDKLIAASGRHKERIDKLQRMDAAADLGNEVRNVATSAAAIDRRSESWDEQLAATIRGVFSGQHSGEIVLPELAAGRAPFTRALETVANVDVPTDFATRVAVYQRTLSPWLGLATVINGTDISEVKVEALRAMGLARGGSMDNAVVIDGDEIMNPEGLRRPDEFVRHKALDAIGDLFVLGAPVLGRFEGVLAGHGLNNALVRALLATPHAWRLRTLAPELAEAV